MTVIVGGGLQIVTDTAQAFNYFARTVNGAQNDNFGWKFWLTAGNYVLRPFGRARLSGRPPIDWYIYNFGHLGTTVFNQNPNGYNYFFPDIALSWPTSGIAWLQGVYGAGTGVPELTKVYLLETGV